VIAAKGFEKETFFEMAARDIRALPKLEGTVHVNIALIVKFMANYFFNPAPYLDVAQQNAAANDSFLFAQGAARGLGQVQFQDYEPVFQSWDLPNVRIFQEQTAVLREFLATAIPDESQQKDVDFLLALGELFTLVVYGQLILENARIYGEASDVEDQVFDFMVRDMSKFALQLHGKPSSTGTQMDLCMRIIRKPAANPGRYARVWRDHVYVLMDAYQMNP
jgi:acyl-CoA dehydrogenase